MDLLCGSANLRAIQMTLTLFTVHPATNKSSIRDPLPRFLSGYHEISKRRETPLFQAHMHPLPSNATDPEKLKQLSKLLTLLQRYPNLDAHVGLQSNFFPRRRKIPLFRVEDGPKPVQDFLCRSLDCANRKSITPDTAPCPRIPLSSHRSRKDPDYRIPQYDIQPELLSPELIQRITDLYREDYCAFGYAAWPGARLDCSK